MRHADVLAASGLRTAGRMANLKKKDFHVSPFFPMDHEVPQWSFDTFRGETGSPLRVAMENLDRRSRRMGRTPCSTLLWGATSPRRARAPSLLVRHPWMTGTVHAAIYWQALRPRRSARRSENPSSASA